MNYDIVVCGGSLGGVLAAYSAAKSGMRVALFEETAWIGGQLTSQAVPPDEHPLIETTGCTASYRAYRNAVRAHYLSAEGFSEEVKKRGTFCPGGSTVSRLAHPPRLAHELLSGLLKLYIDGGTLSVFVSSPLEGVEVRGDEISSLTFGGKKVTAKLYLDGTDTGELIARSGCEYVVGAESAEETGEKHAPKMGDPADLQPVTWVAAIEDRRTGDYVIDRPAEYNFFKKLRTPYDDKPVLGWYGPDSSTGRAKRFGMYFGERDENGPLFALFPYRRIKNSAFWTDGSVPYDVTLLNWPQNDFFLGNLIDCPDAAENARLARSLTLSFLYWLQTEAERPDGGKGYRHIALNRTELGTDDGLAMAPYHRESRRIRALFTVREEHVATGTAFSDSVGVGSYPIDLHITTRSHSFFYAPTKPFTIPLGAMIPVRMKNLLPACKNIGTTHLTNGCFRLHPVEWNVGESCGLLAAFSLREGVSPREIREKPEVLQRFRECLRDNGIQLEW